VPNPWLIVVALGLWIVSVAGTWVYRGYVDSGQVVSAERGIAAKSGEVALKAAQDAARDARALQAAADVRSSRLQDQLDSARAEYDKASQVLAHAKLPSCPIPVADISVLYAPAASTGGGAKDNHPGPAAGSAKDQPGTVDAAVVIANEELNQQAYERKRAALEQCIGQYDDVRAKVNGP